MIAVGLQVGMRLRGFRERIAAPDRDGELARGDQRGQLRQRLGRAVGGVRTGEPDAATRPALLADLMLEGSGGDTYPVPGADPAAVVTAWLASMRAGMRDPSRRAAVLAVTGQADTDPDSALALARLTADRLEALNELLEPSGVKVAAQEYALLTGPLMSRILFERGAVSDEFIDAVVAGWLAPREGGESAENGGGNGTAPLLFFFRDNNKNQLMVVQEL